MKLLHTADWQIGAPFARIVDPQKRAAVRAARVNAVRTIRELAHSEAVDLVVVAGDLFDSPSPDNSAVSAVCAAIGAMEVPVIVIPGNHDCAGPGAVWEQDFFQRERRELAPNLVLLLEEQPYVLESAVVLPCPLVYRGLGSDPTTWLRSPALYKDLPPDRPRVVLAHGAIQAFGIEADEEWSESYAPVFLDVGGIPQAEVDYIALGDWHGTKQVGPKAWYAGTPEPDRFPRGDDYSPGNVLVVEVQRGALPHVKRVPTGQLNWLAVSFSLGGEDSVAELQSKLQLLLGQRIHEDLLQLTLEGSVTLEESDELSAVMERLEARLLRLRLIDRSVVVPSPEEMASLGDSTADPLTARVARRLLEQLEGGGSEEAAVARLALRELYSVWKREGGA